MITRRIAILAVCALLSLSACGPQRHLTEQQVKSVVGLSMEQVENKLGQADSTTNAGDSIWWEYINVTMPTGFNDGACHVVFKDGVATEVRC